MIIADSSGLFSLLVETDKNHSRAIKISLLKTFQKRIEPIIIPAEVFSELINVIGKKLNHKTAFDLGKFILQSKEFILKQSNERCVNQALVKFKNQPESVSFTDCLVMTFADQFQTKDIFGFDEVFRKNKYRRLGIDQ